MAAPTQEQTTLASERLISAAAMGDAGLCAAALAAGAPINQLVPDVLVLYDGERLSGTALHVAAVEGRMAPVRLLLAMGAGVNALCGAPRRATPLFAAVRGGWTEIARVLLEAGADGDAVDTTTCQAPAIVAAVLQGGVELVKVLCEVGHVNTNAVYDCPCGQAPLHAAVKSGNLDMVAVLIAHGANVNKACGTCATALGIALIADPPNLPMIEAVCDAGADLDAPLMRDPHDPTKVLSSALWAAVEDENRMPGVFELLLKRGANPSRKRADGKSMFEFCLRDGKEKFLRMILEHGIDKADVEMKHSPLANMNGLHIAVLLSKCDEVIKAIIPYIDNIDARDRRAFAIDPSDPGGYNVCDGDEDCGFTALYYSARAGNLFATRLLLDLGANVEGFAKNPGDPTPLAAAANNGATDVVNLLIERGADPNFEVAKTRCTPIFLAALGGHNKTIIALMDRGADLQVRDSHGHLASTYARGMNHDRTALLVDRLIFADSLPGTDTSCGKCSAPHARKKCAACRLERYCDRECQRAGWKDHRARCLGR